MKYICVFLFALVAVVCVNGQGIPTKQCPPGEHSVLYCPRKAEPDCGIPTVHDRATTDPPAPAPCGVPDCFCDAPTVRDLRTGNCVPLDQCQSSTC